MGLVQDTNGRKIKAKWFSRQGQGRQVPTWEELRPDFYLSTHEKNGLDVEYKGEYKVRNPMGENTAAYLVI